MENAIDSIVELKDLPNYKDIFTDPLNEFGVTSVDDLLLVLKDEERTKALIDAVKGLGPKTIQCWKNVLLIENNVSSENCSTESISEPVPEEKVIEESTEEVAEDVVTEEPVDTAQEEIITPAVEEGPQPPITEEIVTEAMPISERNLFCSMEDLKMIQRTTVDLLRMNGSKKKGRTASVEYVSKRLADAGLDVEINKESGFPAVIASKGEGGLILWGHLDNEPMKGMKRKAQGEVLGDMVRGRGAANMKGAVAAMVCAADRLSSWHIPFTIILTTDALDEQKGAESLASRTVVTNSNGILFLGPTGMRPIVGQVGYAAVKVRTTGDDAVMRMVDFLNRLNGKVEQSSGRLSIKPGSIKGGRKKRPFESPGSCDVTIELKTMDPVDEAIKELDGLLEGEEHEIEVLCQSEMVHFDGSSDLARAMADLTKKEPTFEMVHSEAPKVVFGNQKITIWGPGNMATAVTDQEYVTLSELEGTYETILALFDRMLTSEDRDS
jgi:acetylornithine deacetylase/succinyl-diaminopimelate desuccinylase-like protein